jgi:hypothetical protein
LFSRSRVGLFTVRGSTHKLCASISFSRYIHTVELRIRITLQNMPCVFTYKTEESTWRRTGTELAPSRAQAG